MVVGLPAIVPSNHLTLESSLPTQSIERLFTIAQWFALLGSAWRNIPISLIIRSMSAMAYYVNYLEPETLWSLREGESPMIEEYFFCRSASQ
jgi:hypothetical protein